MQKLATHGVADNRERGHEQPDRQPRNPARASARGCQASSCERHAGKVDLRRDEQEPHRQRESRAAGDGGRRERNRRNNRREQQPELRSHEAVNQQLPPPQRRRKQKLSFRLRELEEPALERQKPSERRHHQQRRPGEPRARRPKDGQDRVGRRRSPAASRGARSCSPHPREEREIQVCGADDGANQIPRLAQAPQPDAQPVPRAADDDVRLALSMASAAPARPDPGR